MPGEPRVIFTEYALTRMHQRDIDEEDVRAALGAPPSRHKRRKDGRAEARTRIRRKTLLVVYRREPDGITVINAMWE